MFDASFVAAVPEGFEGTLREGVLPWQPISVLVSDIVSPSSLLSNDVVLVLGIQILGFAGQHVASDQVSSDAARSGITVKYVAQ